MFPAFGTSWRLFFQSVLGSCWLCITVSSTSSSFCQGPRWPCFATMSPRSPICARSGAPGLLLSAPLRRRSSVGRNLFGFDWLCSSFWDPQCSRGHSLPSSPAPQLRVVSQHGRILIFDASVAGDDRPICHLRQSPLLHLLLALPRPSLGGDGLAPPVLGRSPGVRFSSVVHSSPGVGEASGVSPDPPHPQRPWFVDLLQLSVAPPVTLSARPDLLFQPRSRRCYPGLHRLAFMPGDCPAIHQGGWFSLAV